MVVPESWVQPYDDKNISGSVSRCWDSNPDSRSSKVVRYIILKERSSPMNIKMNNEDGSSYPSKGKATHFLAN